MNKSRGFLKMSKLFNSLFSTKRGEPIAKKPSRLRLALETLESREVPTAYTWTPTAAGTYNWNDAANWGGAGFPNATDDVANVNIDIAAGTQTINLNVPITIGTLNLGDSVPATPGIFNIVGNGGSLNLDVAAGSATIATATGSGSDSIAAPIALNDPLALNVAAGLSLSGPITETGGSFGLTKSGAAVASLTGSSNSYTGPTTISAGTLSVATLANGGLPSSIGASTNAATNLVLGGGRLTLSATGSTTSIDRSLTLTAASTIEVTAANETLVTSGSVAGVSGTNAYVLTKEGAGKLNFTANDALTTGNINVNAGTLGVANITLSKRRIVNIAAGAFVESSGQLATTADGSVNPNYQVIGAGTLKLISTTNNGTSSYDIYFNSNDTPGSTANWGSGINATIDLGASQRFITGKSNHNGFGRYQESTDSVLKGSIIGAGGITFVGQITGFGDMEEPFALYGANSFTGPVVIQRGSVYLMNAAALNGNAVSFNVSAGAGSLFLYGHDTTISNLSSTGSGTARISNGNRSSGDAILLPAATLTINQTADSTFSGTIVDAFYEYSGGGSNTQGLLNVTKTGPATLTLAGTNTYTGVTTVSAGSLAVPSFTGLSGATTDAANLVIGTGVLRYTGDTNSTDRGITLMGASSGIDVSNSATLLTVTGNVTGTGGLTKLGAGALSLTGASDYAGATTVSAGTLGGPGNAASATSVSGVLNPGSSGTIGIYTTTNLSFGVGGSLAIDLNGAAGSPVAGTDYDQVSATASVNLTNAMLTLQAGSTSTNIGDTFTIINNGGGAVTGTFVGLPQNSYTYTSGQFFQINYHGGDGNDVVLTRATPPTVYVDDSWAGFSNGQSITDADPIAPGNQGAIFGTTAFASITAGINGSAASGNLVVNAGNYPEAVVINKPLAVVFQEGAISVNSLATSASPTFISITVDSSASPITLTVGGSGASTSLNAAISGPGGLTKAGAGVLTLSGLDTYAGDTTISGGAIKVGSATALSTASAISIASGGKLQLNGFSAAAGSLVGTGIVENASATPATLTFGGTNLDATFGGTIQDGVGGGALSVSKVGTAVTSLTGTASSYTGPTTISGGTLSVAALANGGSPSSIGASGSAASNLVLAGGTLRYAAIGSTTTINRSITLSAISTVEVTDASTTLVTSGTVAGGTNAFFKTGAGKLTFSTNDAFTTGAINVVSGTLGVANISVSKDRVLNISLGGIVESSGQLNTISDANVTPNYVVTGGGTLALTSTTNNGTSSFDIYFNFNDISGTAANWGTAIDANIDLGASQRYFTGKSNHNGFGVYSVSTDVFLQGSISGTGGITFAGQPTLRSDMEQPFVLFGANSFTGPVVIQSGSVYLFNPQALNGNEVRFEVPAGATGNLFLYGNDTAISNLSSTGLGTARIANGNRTTGDATQLPAVTLTINQTLDKSFSGTFLDASYEYSSGGGNTQGALNITKTGSATLALSGANTYTGVTAVSGGTLSVASIGALGAAAADPANLVIGGATLIFTGGPDSTPRGFTVAGASGTVVVANAGTTVTFAGNVTGSSSLVKSGAGTILLTGINDFSGSTTVTAGAYGGAGNGNSNTTVSGLLNPGTLNGIGILSTANLAFGAGGSLSINFNGAAGGPVAGTDYDQVNVNGTANLTNASLTLLAGGTPTALGDTLTIISKAGSSDLVTGTFTGLPQNGVIYVSGQLFQINYHGGDGNDVVLTRIVAPTVYVDDNWAGFSNGQAITDADPVAAGNQAATFNTTAFASVNAAIAAVNVGTVIIVNAGTYPEAVNVNKAVGLTIQEGPVSFGSLSGNVAGASVTLSVNIANQGVTLTTGGSASTQFDGVILGIGNLTKAGTGSLTLTATNLFTGTTNVNGGSLVIASSGALLSSPLIINSTGVAIINAANVVLSDPTVNAGGTLRLNGYSKTLSTLTGLGTVENASATPATLTINSAGPSSFGGVLQDGVGGGALTLLKTGSDVFSLTGSASTYTGTTTVSAGVLSVGSLADGGLPSSVGSSPSAATNLVVQNGATLRYGAVGGTASSNRDITIGAGGATFDVPGAGSNLILSGVLVGGSNALTKSGAGKVTFTSDSAFGTRTTSLGYGTVTTGNITVTGGELQTGYLRLNQGRDNGQRNLAIAAGAVVTATGTVDIDPSQNVYTEQIAGPGTLKLRNPNASASNPSLANDIGDAGGDGGPWGSFITAIIDVGTTATQWFAGKTNRNDVSRYAGDQRFDAPFVGSANIQFVGLNNNGGRNMHWVLNADNTGFTGGVFIANADLDLTNNNALTAANSVTFNSQVDPNTLNDAKLFLWGHNVTIGSLNDISATGTTSYIRNGALDQINGGTNYNNNGATLGVALGLQADSTLTIAQTSPGAFNGVINDGPNDNSTGDPGPYRTLSIVKTGSSSLTLTGANAYTGTTEVSAGTLVAGNTTGSATGTGVVTLDGTGKLGGSGGVGAVLATPGSTVSPGLSPGRLNTLDLSLDTGSILKIELNGTTVATQYDQVDVTGAINLNADSSTGATLTVTVGYPVLIGDTFTIIKNEQNNAIAGTFNGLADLSTFVASGVTFRITYFGGTGGHDVVLTALTGSTVPPPTLVGAPVVNGGSAYAAFAGPQRSDVVSLQLTFSQPVTLGAGAYGMTVHANNLNEGAIPTFAQTSPDGGLTWIITFTGANSDPTFTDPTGALFGPGAPANGFRSLADGVYDFTVNLANVHLVSNPSVAGSGSSTEVVSRLFGNADTTGEVSGVNHTAIVNTADNLLFRGAFNTPANYHPYFDFNGDGQINTTDNLQFRNRFNHPLSWTE